MNWLPRQLQARRRQSVLYQIGLRGLFRASPLIVIPAQAETQGKQYWRTPLGSGVN